MTIQELCDASHKTAVEKGWWENPRTIPEALCLVHSEVSEALEEWRDGHSTKEIYYFDNKPDKPEGFPIEIADVMIRLGDLCAREGIDLEKAIAIKMEYNKIRPFLHGGKKI